ncbi:MAG: hypothetical protein HY057_06475 [Rhodospirillales bacterium]|nr:hypothetical protein [Rhodospirillales bacterium]
MIGRGQGLFSADERAAVFAPVVQLKDDNYTGKTILTRKMEGVMSISKAKADRLAATGKQQAVIRKSCTKCAIFGFVGMSLIVAAIAYALYRLL